MEKEGRIKLGLETVFRTIFGDRRNQEEEAQQPIEKKKEQESRLDKGRGTRYGLELDLDEDEGNDKCDAGKDGMDTKEEKEVDRRRYTYMLDVMRKGKVVRAKEKDTDSSTDTEEENEGEGSQYTSMAEIMNLGRIRREEHERRRQRAKDEEDRRLRETYPQYYREGQDSMETSEESSQESEGDTEGGVGELITEREESMKGRYTDKVVEQKAGRINIGRDSEEEERQNGSRKDVQVKNIMKDIRELARGKTGAEKNQIVEQILERIETEGDWHIWNEALNEIREEEEREDSEEGGMGCGVTTDEVRGQDGTGEVVLPEY